MGKLTAAEGYFELGMFTDAWATSEDLEIIARTDPLTLELRLRILTALERWELGGQIAGVLLCSDVEGEKCREPCARFHHAYARALSLAGGGDGSRR